MSNSERYTIRWRRGDAVAYVLAGKQLSSHVITDVVTTVEVRRTGGSIWPISGHMASGGWLPTMREGRIAEATT
ncbi:MAG: hypothetical protein ACT4NY_06695 [Pseudonocardiales bacterium]